MDGWVIPVLVLATLVGELVSWRLRTLDRRVVESDLKVLSLRIDRLEKERE